MRRRSSARKPTWLPGTVIRCIGMRRCASGFLALAVMLGLLTACDPAQLNTYPPTPPGSSDTPDSDEVEEKRYAKEATKDFLEYQKLETKMLSQNKTSGEPPWLKKYTAGDFYPSIRKRIDRMNKVTYRFEEGAEAKIANRTRKHDVLATRKDGKKQVQVTLRVCSDMTKVNVVDKKTGKPIRKASLVYRVVWMSGVAEGPYKVVRSQSYSVRECPF